MLDAAVLAIIEEAGVNVLTMTEGLDESEFLSTRLTRQEVRRQLVVMNDAMSGLSLPARKEMQELDWEGWAVAAGRMGKEDDDAIWFLVRSLVPATLMWLRLYRTMRPELFAYDAEAK